MQPDQRGEHPANNVFGVTAEGTGMINTSAAVASETGVPNAGPTPAVAARIVVNGRSHALTLDPRCSTCSANSSD